MQSRACVRLHDTALRSWWHLPRSEQLLSMRTFPSAHFVEVSIGGPIYDRVHTGEFTHPWMQRTSSARGASFCPSPASPACSA